MPRIASSTLIVPPGASAELGRRLRRGVGRREVLVEPEASGLERLEGQVQRHHLGERRRVVLQVGVVREQDFAGVGVDHEGGERARRRPETQRQRQNKRGSANTTPDTTLSLLPQKAHSRMGPGVFRREQNPFRIKGILSESAIHVHRTLGWLIFH